MFQRISKIGAQVGLIATLFIIDAPSPSQAFSPQLTVKSSRKAVEQKRLADEAAAKKRALEVNAAKAMDAKIKTTAPPSDTSPQKASPKVKSTTEAKGITFSNPIEYKWRLGVVAKAGGRVGNAVFAIPVPKNWPEQTVAVVEEELPPTGIVEDRRKQDQGLEQLVVRFRQLEPNQKVVITKTFLVTTSQINSPENTTVFVRPPSRLADARKYSKPSASIKFSNSKLKKQVKTLAEGKENAWQEVEAIYDWVRDNIEDVTVDPSQIVNVFLNQKGCNEDKVSLFVGMCRANKIPARIVWVQGTIYAEFMLVDGSGKIHWFPCNIGGVREFGSYAEPRIILQKGDNFRTPEESKNLKYVSEVFQGQVIAGQKRPIYKFFTELLPVD